MAVSTGLNSQAPTPRFHFSILPSPLSPADGPEGVQAAAWLAGLSWLQPHQLRRGTAQLLPLQPLPPLWNVRLLIFIKTWWFGVSQQVPSQVTSFSATEGEGNISDHSKSLLVTPPFPPHARLACLPCLHRGPLLQFCSSDHVLSPSLQS